MIIARDRMLKMKEGERYPIEVYGNLVTRQAEASLKCRECGKSFNTRIFITYIRPTAINIMFHRTKYSPFLHLMREKSNSVNLIGTVTKEPFLLNDKEVILDSEGKQVWIPVDTEEIVFPLAISRNYAVMEDLDNTTDFPLIAAKTLDTELEYVRPGSSILIRGSVWNKKINRVIKCTECGTENQFEDEATLIFPYNVEFLFSSKNQYAIGAAINTLDDELNIIIKQDGEVLTDIAQKKYLLEPEYENARKALYPRTIKKIIPKSSKKIEIEIDDNFDIQESQEIENLKNEIKGLEKALLERTGKEIKKKESKIAKLSKDLTKKNEALKDYSDKLTKEKEKSDKLKAQNKRTSKVISKLSEDLKNKNETLSKLSKANEQKKRKIDKLEKELKR